MKKKIMILFFIACLAITLGAVNAQAGSYTGMTGTTWIGATGSTAPLNISTNDYCDYYGAAVQYAATCHNKAGDKVYATGGGGANASGIFYKQSANYIGSANSCTLINSSTFDGSGWTAQ